MKNIVPDANVFIHRYFKVKGMEAEREAATDLFKAAYLNRVKLIVPELFWSELATSMIRFPGVDRNTFEGNFEITQEMVADRVLATARRSNSVLMRAFDISRMETNPDTKRVRILDTIYHALAENRDGTFVTADQNYLDAVEGLVPGALHLVNWEDELD